MIERVGIKKFKSLVKVLGVLVDGRRVLNVDEMFLKWLCKLMGIEDWFVKLDWFKFSDGLDK